MIRIYQNSTKCHISDHVQHKFFAEILHPEVTLLAHRNFQHCDVC